jgi:hypothetical protein
MLFVLSDRTMGKCWLALFKVTSQRRTYKELESHPTDQPRTNNMITEEQVNLLNGIGYVEA